MAARPLKTWRWIGFSEASGPLNMAIDEALVQYRTRHPDALPVFRFYRWSPATLSLGRFQNLDQGFQPHALDHCPVVRRATGGGGIWHDDELTYSLACLQEDLGILGVKASFEILCGFLLRTWQNLGWDASFAKDQPNNAWGAFTPACFAGTEEYDILVAGKKLGGNAQKRQRNAIFQHGSIPWRLDWAALDHLFLPDYRPNPRLVTDLLDCGYSDSRADLMEHLQASFAECLGIRWEASELNAEEQTLVQQLLETKYANPVWTGSAGGSLRV